MSVRGLVGPLVMPLVHNHFCETVNLVVRSLAIIIDGSVKVSNASSSSSWFSFSSSLILFSPGGIVFCSELVSQHFAYISQNVQILSTSVIEMSKAILRLTTQSWGPPNPMLDTTLFFSHNTCAEISQNLYIATMQ